MKTKQTLLLYGMLISLCGSFLFAQTTLAANCGGVETSLINCDPGTNGVWGLLLFVVNLLSAGVGLVAIGGIVYASILYTSAKGAVDQVKRAIKIIINVATGLALYALMYALINFLVPGGLLNAQQQVDSLETSIPESGTTNNGGN